MNDFLCGNCPMRNTYMCEQCDYATYSIGFRDEKPKEGVIENGLY